MAKLAEQEKFEKEMARREGEKLEEELKIESAVKEYEEARIKAEAEAEAKRIAEHQRLVEEARKLEAERKAQEAKKAEEKKRKEEEAAKKKEEAAKKKEEAAKKSEATKKAAEAKKKAEEKQAAIAEEKAKAEAEAAKKAEEERQAALPKITKLQPQLVSPKNEYTFSEDFFSEEDKPKITFTWKPVDTAMAYRFVLKNSEGKNLVVATVKSNKYVLSDKISVLSESGTYEWSVTAMTKIDKKTYSSLTGSRKFTIKLEEVGKTKVDISNLITTK